MKANEQFLQHGELIGHLTDLDKILQANATTEMLDKLTVLVPDYKRNPQAVDWVFLQKSGISVQTIPVTPDIIEETTPESDTHS